MRYLRIGKCDVCNGIGIRVTLWLSGCSHCCENCHNKESWNPNGGEVFDEKAKREIFDELDKGFISGITLSGGDPLHENNLDGVNQLLHEIRILYPNKNKSVWLYTGYTWEEIFNHDKKDSLKEINNNLIRQDIIKKCDVVIDGPYIDSLRDVTLPWRGSPNQRIIDVQETLSNGEITLWGSN